MELGAFSVSLSVSNIEESKRFYQKLGFEIVGGDQSQQWLILQNGAHKIGLFSGNVCREYNDIQSRLGSKP